MKTALRFCLGLLLTVSAVGCHTCQRSCPSSCDSGCGHRSCLHKVVSRFRGGNCGCQSDCDGGGHCDGCGSEAGCDCGHHHHQARHKSKVKYQLPAEAAMYGYDNSVVYAGDDWQGIPQPVTGMPMAGGCSGCAGGAPMMSMPATGCSGCGGSGISPVPGEGGCASCGGTGSAPQPAPGGCASCGGNHPTPSTAAPSAPPSGGGCASCGAGATDSFYNPMGPNHLSPAPAPPAEGAPAPTIESVPGDNKAAGSSEQIQKIHWVPRQL